MLWCFRSSTYARAALLFFVVAFLTFMSIAAFPAFVMDMRVIPTLLKFRLQNLTISFGTARIVTGEKIQSNVLHL